MNGAGPSWSRSTLGDLIEVALGGGTPSRANPKYWNGSIPWTRSAHIDQSGGVAVADWITENGLSESSSNLAPKGSILVGTRVGVGKVAVAPHDVAISQDLTALVPKQDRVTSDFLAFALTAPEVRAQFRGATRGSTIQGIPRDDLLAFTIPMPSLQEQRAIAHVLRSAQRAKDATEQVVASARQLQKSLLRSLFASPDWDVRPLGEVARIERGKFSHRPRNDPAFYGGDVPFVQTGDVVEARGRLTTYRQTLNEAGLAVSRVFPAGTIVITIAANIGHVGILDFDSAFPDSLIGITPDDHISNQFLNYYLITQQPEMDRIAPRGTQKNINIQFLRPWPVPVPPRDVQEEIVSALRAVDRKIAAEESRRDALGVVFDSLLREMMTARLRVTDLKIPA